MQVALDPSPRCVLRRDDPTGCGLQLVCLPLLDDDLLAALGASSVDDGKPALLSRVQTVNETIDAAWGLGLAALAVVGGLTRTVGNRLTIPFGVVGGLAFALASATIPYTDTFDPAFKIGSLLSVWAVAVGVITLRRLSDGREPLTPEPVPQLSD